MPPWMDLHQMWCGVRVAVADIITCAEFLGNWLGARWFCGGWKMWFLIDKVSRCNAELPLPYSKWFEVIAVQEEQDTWPSDCSAVSANVFLCKQLVDPTLCCRSYRNLELHGMETCVICFGNFFYMCLLLQVHESHKYIKEVVTRASKL